MGFRANERKTYEADKNEAYKDKSLFVKNLGWILSQTRTGVTSCRLINDGLVGVSFGAGEILINITDDSYTQIILDVCKSLI